MNLLYARDRLLSSDQTPIKETWRVIAKSVQKADDRDRLIKFADTVAGSTHTLAFCLAVSTLSSSAHMEYIFALMTHGYHVKAEPKHAFRCLKWLVRQILNLRKSQGDTEIGSMLQVTDDCVEYTSISNTCSTHIRVYEDRTNIVFKVLPEDVRLIEDEFLDGEEPPYPPQVILARFRIDSSGIHSQWNPKAETLITEYGYMYHKYERMMEGFGKTKRELQKETPPEILRGSDSYVSRLEAESSELYELEMMGRL